MEKRKAEYLNTNVEKFKRRKIDSVRQQNHRQELKKRKERKMKEMLPDSELIVKKLRKVRKENVEWMLSDNEFIEKIKKTNQLLIKKQRFQRLL